MKDMKLVSAIITTHNRCDLLAKAIESVKRQSYENIEIIVVDDNSDKNTVEYLSNLKGIKYIRIDAEHSKGGNHARNVGIDAAKGEYIAFLDDDDEWLPEKTRKQVDLMSKYKDVGLVYCGHIEQVNFKTEIKKRCDDVRPIDYSQLCFEKIFCTTSMIMMRRDLAVDAGKFDENLRFWQEYDFCIRMSQKTMVAAVPEPEIILRIVDGDKTRLTNKYDGWNEAVEYINNKYKNEINNLPYETQQNRKLMILRERAYRCEKAGLKKQKKECLFEIWRITKNPKHFIKYMLNISKFYS